MARRRVAELPAGAEPFDRSVQQWRELGAPTWVFELAAAAEAYVAWAQPGYGGGLEPDDVLVRRHYARKWMAQCVKPQWLAQAGALLDAEVQLLSGDRWARWGRPGRCRSRMLAPGADVPVWLTCCRRDPRGTT
jgi:hypothetical protein